MVTQVDLNFFSLIFVFKFFLSFYIKLWALELFDFFNLFMWYYPEGGKSSQLELTQFCLVFLFIDLILIFFSRFCFFQKVIFLSRSYIVGGELIKLTQVDSDILFNSFSLDMFHHLTLDYWILNFVIFF